MPEYTFKDPKETRPGEVECLDAFAVKVVAVVGYGNDWTAFIGPSDWTDEEVAQHGSKLLAVQAEPLFYVLRNSGRVYDEY